VAARLLRRARSIAGVLVATTGSSPRRELKLEDLYLVGGAYAGGTGGAIFATALAARWRGRLRDPALKRSTITRGFVGSIAAGATHLTLASRARTTIDAETLT